MIKTSREENISMYPRLEEVLMIESFIREHNGEYKKQELIDNLPEETNQEIFDAIIDNLLDEHKISIDAEGKIGWIYDPAGVKKYLKKNELSWR